MKTLKIVSALLVCIAFGPLASAQTLGEVMLVAAISAELNPAISLPRGTFRAVGEGAEQIIAQVPESNKFTNWEVYSAGGLAANLQAGYVHQVSTSFAVNGYFLAEETERTVGDTVHTRYVFDDGMGGTTLLYTIRGPQDLIYLIAEGI